MGRTWCCPARTEPPQHPYQHGPERPLLAVDQELGEGAGLGIHPVAADRIGAVEVGEHEDPEQFGARATRFHPAHQIKTGRITVCESSSDLRLEVGERELATKLCRAMRRWTPDGEN